MNEPRFQRRAIVQALGEGVASVADKMIADVLVADFGGRVRAGAGGYADRLARDLDFRLARAARQVLHGTAIAIAGGEFLPRVDAGGVVAQHRLDEARAFEEDAPVERGEQPQRGHAVADGDLVGCLSAVFARQGLGRRARAQSSPGPCAAPELRQRANQERIGRLLASGAACRGRGSVFRPASTAFTQAPRRAVPCRLHHLQGQARGFSIVPSAA